VTQEEKYKAVVEDVNRHVQAVADSKSRKRVVAAGPGTGKTFLFKKILVDKRQALVLTFINALVEDLHVQLPTCATVRTLHSFARSTLAKSGVEPRMYDRLTDVIERDAEILAIKPRNFASRIRNDATEAELDFYLRRKAYYGTYFSHDDLGAR
jgi:hypothetical protein